MKQKGRLNLSKLLPKKYLQLLTNAKRYNILTGGKDTGKSWTISLIIMIKLLFRRNSDILVLRKFNKDHLGSTYKQIKKIISLIDKLLLGQFAKRWKFTKTPTPEITFLSTGRKIYFAGLDDPGRVAGLTSDDVDIYIGMIWVEEPIEVSDMKSKTAAEMQEILKINWETIEDSIFRFYEDAIANPKFEIYMTMNMWNFYQSWIAKYFPYKGNLDFEEDQDEKIEKLETIGYLEYIDDDYMGGEGIRLLHTSYKLLENFGVLPEKTRKKHLKRKYNDLDSYHLISLGIPRVPPSLPLKRFESKYPHVATLSENQKLIPYMASIDIAQLQDNSVLEYLWVKKEIGGIKPKIIYDEIIYKGEKICNHRYQSEQVKMMIDDIESKLNEYPEIIERGPFRVLYHHSADYSIYEPFMKELTLRGLTNKIILTPAPQPNAKANNILRRMKRWEEGFELNRIVIYDDCELLKNTIFNIEVDNNLNRIEDKRILDAINAAEHPLNQNYGLYKAHWSNEGYALRNDT